MWWVSDKIAVEMSLDLKGGGIGPLATLIASFLAFGLLGLTPLVGAVLGNRSLVLYRFFVDPGIEVAMNFSYFRFG
jgi:hypothetical protein